MHAALRALAVAALLAATLPAGAQGPGNPLCQASADIPGCAPPPPPPPGPCPLPPEDDPPAVFTHAGRDQTWRGWVDEPNRTEDFAVVEGRLVTLDGSCSVHRDGRPQYPNGFPLRYEWVQLVGPAVALSNPNAVRPTFIAPPRPDGWDRNCDGVVLGTQQNLCLQFQLTASDHLGNSNTSTVDILVNSRPTADAGPDQVHRERELDEDSGYITSTGVLLNGIIGLDEELELDPAHPGSRDPIPAETARLRYFWRQVAGPEVALYSFNDFVGTDRLVMADDEPLVIFTVPSVPEEAAFVDLEFDLRVRDDLDIHAAAAESPPDRIRIRVLPYVQEPEIFNLRVLPDSVDLEDHHGGAVLFSVEARAKPHDPTLENNPSTPGNDFHAGLEPTTEVRTVSLYLESPAGQTIQVPMLLENGTTYRGFLMVGDPRLSLDPGTSTTTWTVYAVAHNEAGLSNSTRGREEDDLTVSGPAGALPALRLTPVPPEPAPGFGEPCFDSTLVAENQTLGRGEALELDVCIDGGRSFLIQDVSYRIGVKRGNPPVEVFGERINITSPYRIPASSLAGGVQDILVRLRDRVGHSVEMKVPVIVDFGPPDVFALAPDVTYRNVTFPIVLFVQDDTPLEAVLDLDDRVRIMGAGDANVTSLPEMEGFANQKKVTDFLLATFRDQDPRIFDLLAEADPQGRVLDEFLAQRATEAFVFLTNRTELGNATFSYFVRDRASNEVGGGGALRTELPFTDAFLKSAKNLDPNVLPGQPVRVEAVVRQAEGIGTIPFTVRVMGDGKTLNSTVDVPKGADTTVLLQGPYRPGRHTLNVTVAAGPDIIERDPSNQERTVQVEVFLGQTQFNETGKVYWIRADERGLPHQAVDLEARRTFGLQLNQSGENVRYEFVVGHDLLWWDPLARNADGLPVTYVPERAETKAKDSPLPFPVAVLALAVAVALLRRRR